MSTIIISITLWTTVLRKGFTMLSTLKHFSAKMQRSLRNLRKRLLHLIVLVALRAAKVLQIPQPWGWTVVSDTNFQIPFIQLKNSTVTENQDEEDELVTTEMICLQCACTFWNFQPTEVFWAQCPNILVICHRDHPHPIPILTKTPPSIIIDLLGALHQDLPDLTPQWFMCHSAVQVFLQMLLPEITNPTLSDLHQSLTNHNHLWSYITKVQETLFPEGTGWNGT